MKEVKTNNCEQEAQAHLLLFRALYEIRSHHLSQIHYSLNNEHLSMSIHTHWCHNFNWCMELSDFYSYHGVLHHPLRRSTFISAD